MRLFNKMILAAVLFAAFLDAASASGPVLNVWIKDQHDANVADVQVAAVDFGMNGPSTYTVAGLTGADGKVQFTLEAGKNYNIYYSSHGYSPSISDQFNSPVYDPNRNVYAAGATEYFSTFTLTSGLTGVGRIQQQFTGASPSTLLFGGVYNMKSQMQGGTGLAPTDSSGNGTLTVDNVPFAEANTYNINLYDPQKNNGIGRNVMTDLSVGTPTIAYVGAGPTLDFNKSVPAGRIENTAGGTAAAGASVEGVIKSTDGLNVPHMGISIKACVGNQWNSWANSDDNGRFQLYGLTAGVTYYLQIMGGCTWSQADNTSRCYEPMSTPNFNAADICLADPANTTANDIVYVSSDVLYHTVTIDQMPPSTGQIKVCVETTDGFAIPNANVNLNPDGSPWPKTGTSCQTNDPNNYFSKAGFSNTSVNTGADGCATLGGLPSGNYMVNVWTPFSSGGNGPNSFNGNGDDFTGFGMNGGIGINWLQAHCFGTGGNDYRVTVDTTVAPTMHVYNSSGAVVQAGGVDLSSITYTVAAGGNSSGEVSGTLSFPAVTDLRGNPVMITLYPNCSSGSCGAGNFTAIASSGSAQYRYSIHVASGAAYQMNISASGWGRVNKGGGDNTVHLEGSTSAVVNMEFAPAGALTGTLYKPDGTIFTPANNQYIWVDAGSNNGWSNSQLQKDGTFALNDVLPGVNRLSVGSSGGDMSGVSFNYSLPMPAPTVNVIAGSTTTVSLNLVNAVNVGISTSALFGKLPDTTVVADPGSSDMLLGFRVIPVKSGSVLDGTVIQNMLVSGSDGDLRFSYSLPTGSSGNGQCGNNWPGGFCGKAVPSPSVYDFYLMRSGDFGKGSGTTLAEMPYPHFVIISSSKSVIIDAAHANNSVYMSNGMGISSGVLVNVDPSASLAARGNATAKGAVTALNFFRQADYDALGGNFDKFVSYLPLMALYDAGGKFGAAGIVVPSPKFIAEHDVDFNNSFAKGYAEFKKVLDQAGGFGYEIRGLAPSTCYTAVMTTPNYPHYQTRLCTGVNKSTVTLNVNLDSAVGAGSTVFGVVKSSAASPVAIANASVELALEGSETRTAVTTSTGSFRFEGLSGGIAKITVTAPGYAKVIMEEALVGSNSYPENIYLFDAPGSITGTVYSQKLPFAKVQAGAQVVAYDETYNHDNPTSPLPLLTTITGTDGTYLLDGLVPGDLYKVFLKVPGKYTLEVDTTATAGALAGLDFTMLPKPLDVEVFARDNKDTGRYEFTIMNPQDFKDGAVSYSVSPYSGPGTAVNFSKISSGELFGSIPRGNLVDNAVYVLHIDATSLSNKTITKELLFGKNYNNSQQSIDALMLGDDSEDGTGRKNNEASVDKSGSDPSALVLPAGALITSSVAVVPSCSFTAESSNSVAVSTKVAAVPSGASVAGNLYTVSLSSVAQTDRSIELTLAYDKSLPDVSNLNVAQYNAASGKWDTVPGLATVNPVKGTVTVKLKKLASVLSLRNSGPQAVFDGRKYVVRPQGAGGSTSTTGTFAVLNYTGDALAAGSKLKVFNYPNPFNLKTKVMSNNHNAATMPATTYGTMIHVEVPAGNDGACHIRIYTLAGELVKDISDTCVGGKYNYFAWDGRNKSGQEVANGVYYGVVTLSGKSPDRKDATFKMAVIK